MTEVGKMIYEDGRAEGKALGKIEGKIEGKTEMLISLLQQKLKVLPDDCKNKILHSSSKTIDILGNKIFDIESIDDLKKYLN